VACDKSSVMPNSQRPPDKTRRSCNSCLCRARRCELSIESQDRLAKSEQFADGSRSSRGV